jgi:hypothetical protein
MYEHDKDDNKTTPEKPTYITELENRIISLNDDSVTDLLAFLASLKV